MLKLKTFLLSIIIFSNVLFAKEFDQLFKVYTPINNSSEIEKCDAIFIFAELGKVTKNDLFIINKFLDAYKDKVIGWFLINRDSNKI